MLRILRVLALNYRDDMYLSKSCSYAIRSVLLLATEENRKFISISEISKRLDIPFHYLTKILRTLSHSEITISTKGPHGGVGLKTAPEYISLYNVIFAIDGDAVFNQCILGRAECSDMNPCILHEICYETKQVLLHNMKRKSLKEAVLNINQLKTAQAVSADLF